MSKLSVTPPVKSSRASDVLPPFSDSYPPYSLLREEGGREREGEREGEGREGGRGREGEREGEGGEGEREGERGGGERTKYRRF